MVITLGLQESLNTLKLETGNLTENMKTYQPEQLGNFSCPDPASIMMFVFAQFFR